MNRPVDLIEQVARTFCSHAKDGPLGEFSCVLCRARARTAIKVVRRHDAEVAAAAQELSEQLDGF